MKAIIMAGGFAKRLGLENKSKCLIEVGGKPIIDYTIDKLNEIPELDEVIVITNDVFYNDFVKWAKNKENVRVVSDGGTSEESKKGALTSFLDFLDKENIDDDIFWAGADNFFLFSLKKAYDVFKNEDKNLAIFYDINDKEKAKNFGAALVENNIIVDFEEKPSLPKSTIISACMYFIKKDTLPLVKELRKSEKDRDNMGIVISQLCKKVPVYAYIVAEGNIDIGSKEALERAKQEALKL